MNRVDWDSSSQTERMTPCIGLRAAYRNSIASTANANTEKATLLGQNNHEFQVVITGSSHYSYSCVSIPLPTGHQDEVGACNLTCAGLETNRILTIATAQDLWPIAPRAVQKSPCCMSTNTPG